MNTKYPNGQTVVFQLTENTFKVGTILSSKPTPKRIEYMVYGEDGKVYSAIPNKTEGLYRICPMLTEKFCAKHNIEANVDEIILKQLSEKVIPDSDLDTSIFDASFGDTALEPVVSESES